MRWLRKVRSLLRKDKLDAEMAEEMRLHVELQTELNRKTGMNAEEARYAALRQFGNVAGFQEQAREARGWLWMEQAVQDFHLAARQMRRHPGFAAVAVLTLALGIGANTALFSVINAVLLRSLPVPEPAGVVLFSHHGESGPGERPQHTNFPLYEYLRDHSRALSGVLAFSPLNLRVGAAPDSTSVAAQWVTPNYFSVLGIAPVFGRGWAAGDEAHPLVVVVSHRFWARQLGADAGAIGREIQVAGHRVTVIGVLPPGFPGLVPGTPTDLTFLLAAQPMLAPQRGNLMELGRRLGDEPAPTWELFILGRLNPGVLPAQAEAESDALLRQWTMDRRLSPALVKASFARAVLQPGGMGLDGLRRRFAQPLWVLAGLVAGVFLIACANVAGLLLARTAARRQELAVRAALGASRGRLARQLLVEAMLLTGFGGVAGLFAGWWGATLLVALIGTGRAPVVLEVQPDWRVLLFGLAASLLAGATIGLVPAWRGVRATDLKDTGGWRHRRWGMRPALVAGQIAVSMCLLVGTGLFAANLRQITSIDPGFQRENLLSVSFDWAEAGLSRAQMMEFAQRAAGLAAAVPGVRSAAATHIEPLGQQQSQRWLSARGAGATVTAVVDLNVVSAGYFHALALPLVVGREFDGRDRADTPKVAVISESVARDFFGETDPIGQSIWIARDTTGTPLTVVGVARDTRQRDLKAAPLRLLFLPATQSAAWEMNLIVRTAGLPAAVVPDLRRVLAAAGPAVPVREITTPQIQLERSLVQERLLAALSGFFGPLALLLAGIGLYGLLAHEVAHRRKEIGVRLALGARPASVQALVVGQGLRLVLAGIAAGLVAAIALGASIRSFLFGIQPDDPWILVLASVALIVVALLACWLPARRAAKVDPVVALRAE